MWSWILSLQHLSEHLPFAAALDVSENLEFHLVHAMNFGVGKTEDTLYVKLLESKPEQHVSIDSCMPSQLLYMSIHQRTLYGRF